MLGEPDGLSRLTDLMRYEAAPEKPSGPPPIDPAIRRRRRRRRLTVGLIVASVILASTGGYTAYALTAPIGNATLEAQAPDVDIPPAAQISWPVDGAYAISISGADEYLGAEASGIWGSNGDNSPRPMASISKLITALVILNAKPLADTTDAGPTITFSRADHALYDKYYVLNATIAEMPTGSSMSERDALETMLIVSASNYAEAVSTWAYGSQGAFLRATKEWLAANGLTGDDARRADRSRPPQHQHPDRPRRARQDRPREPGDRRDRTHEDARGAGHPVAVLDERTDRRRRRHGDQDRHPRRDRVESAVLSDSGCRRRTAARPHRRDSRRVHRRVGQPRRHGAARRASARASTRSCSGRADKRSEPTRPRGGNQP